MVIGIIPARFASTRFPGKPLADLGGKTIIQRVYSQVEKCALIDQVIVATDDDRIKQHVTDFGGNVCMTSDEHKSGTDRCAEVLKSHPQASIVVNIQGDEPFISPTTIDGLIDLMQHDEKAEIGSCFFPIGDDKHVHDINKVKVVMGEQNRALYFSRSVVPFNRDTHSTEYFQHVGLYAFKAEVLNQVSSLPPHKIEIAESLEQLRWLAHGYQIKMLRTDKPSFGIDTPEDLEEAKNLLSA